MTCFCPYFTILSFWEYRWWPDGMLCIISHLYVLGCDSDLLNCLPYLLQRNLFQMVTFLLRVCSLQSKFYFKKWAHLDQFKKFIDLNSCGIINGIQLISLVFCMSPSYICFSQSLSSSSYWIFKGFFLIHNLSFYNLNRHGLHSTSSFSLQTICFSCCSLCLPSCH